MIEDLVEQLRRETKFGAARLAAVLKADHGIVVAPVTVHRIMVRRGICGARVLLGADRGSGASAVAVTGNGDPRGPRRERRRGTLGGPEYRQPKEDTMHTIRANYDLVGSVATAGILLIVGAPWPFWAIWGAAVTYQLGNRIINGWAR